MPIPLGLQDVLTVLLKRHNLPERSRVALRGRLQHLQKQGFPPGVNTGRGKPARYRSGELLLIGLALEFAQFGITPERVVLIVKEAMPEVLSALKAAKETYEGGIEDYSFVALFPEELSRALGEEGDEGRHLLSTTTGGFLRTEMENGPRFAAVSISLLLSATLAVLTEWGLSTEEEILDDLGAWLLERERESY